MEPADQPTVSLSLTVKNTAEALAFYAHALDAAEVFRMPAPDGGIAHAEFTIGTTHIYISDEAEEWHAFAMPEGTLASCLFAVNVNDCDGAYQQAIKAGAESLNPPENQFWGTRSAIIKDPFGYRWSLNQIVEVVSPEEIAKRAQAFFSSES